MATYVNENLSGRDFSNGLTNAAFVDCDMTGVKLPTRCECFTDVNFVNCKFDLIGKGLHVYIRPLCEANYRFTTDYKYDVISNLYIEGKYGYASFYSDWLRQPVDPKSVSFRSHNGEMCYHGYKILQRQNEKGYQNYVLATLMVPLGTPSILYHDCKCRAERAYVRSIQDFYGTQYDEARSYMHYSVITYKVGKEVVADKWDPDPMKECGHGIHFFLTITEAWKYCLSF